MSEQPEYVAIFMYILDEIINVILTPFICWFFTYHSQMSQCHFLIKKYTVFHHLILSFF